MDCDETEDFVGTSSNDRSDVEDDAEQSTEIADMIRLESGMMVLLLKEVNFTSENASLESVPLRCGAEKSGAREFLA
jgi:hypothetical protein